jgi:hypothetical protein
MMALIVGLIICVLGAWGLVHWFGPFKEVVKGLVPVMLVCSGLLAVIAGITSVKDAAEAKKLEEERKKEGDKKEETPK